MYPSAFITGKDVVNRLASNDQSKGLMERTLKLVPLNMRLWYIENMLKTKGGFRTAPIAVPTSKLQMEKMNARRRIIRLPELQSPDIGV
jgi:hypothetical protein